MPSRYELALSARLDKLRAKVNTQQRKITANAKLIRELQAQSGQPAVPPAKPQARRKTTKRGAK